LERAFTALGLPPDRSSQSCPPAEEKAPPPALTRRPAHHEIGIPLPAFGTAQQPRGAFIACSSGRNLAPSLGRCVIPLTLGDLSLTTDASGDERNRGSTVSSGSTPGYAVLRYWGDWPGLVRRSNR
jgi:hypothetical protein